jgi:hypothetical protein
MTSSVTQPRRFSGAWYQPVPVPYQFLISVSDNRLTYIRVLSLLAQMLIVPEGIQFKFCSVLSSVSVPFSVTFPSMFSFGWYLSFSLLQVHTTCFGLIGHLQVYKLVLQGNRYCRFYPQKLAITSLTSGGRSVGIIRSRILATEFSF